MFDRLYMYIGSGVSPLCALSIELLTLLNVAIYLQANIELKWEHCAKLPTDFCVGKATVINGKVYCGGGATDNEYIVYCCDHHKTSGALYHNFLSGGLGWDKSTAS